MGGISKYVEQLNRIIMELKFTDEEFAYLSQHEDRFKTAVFADWARKPIPQAMSTMAQIWNRVTGRDEKVRDSCAHCILRFLKEVGKAYFADKAERQRRAAAEKPKEEPQIKPQEEVKPQESKTASPQPKKAVKGKKSGNKK